MTGTAAATRTEVLGVGLAAQLPCDAELALAPQHPVAHPGFTLVVDVAGEVVTAADAQVGLMHRSAEKLFEARDYRQAMLLANRHDWLSPFCSELTIALAAEEALGLVPPERATWTRTLLVEAQRVSAALSFLAPVAGPSRPPAEALRERFADVLEALTGARVHPGYARIGGVAHPMPDDVRDAYGALAAECVRLADPLSDAVSAYADPFAGVARLTRDDALAWGTSGTVARASGLDLDLRRDDPALAYGELADVLAVAVRPEGDVPARYGLLADQVRSSARLLGVCVERLSALGDGEVDVPLPKVVRLPEGTTYAWLEGPLGICGALVVSTGEKSPWRLKIRSASFATMQAMTAALPGTPREALGAAVMSFPVVMGDVDR